MIATTWKPRELSPDAIEAFVHRGFCTLEGAFTRQQAATVRDLVWDGMRAKAGIDRGNPATWPEAYDIEAHLDEPVVRATFTDRLARDRGHRRHRPLERHARVRTMARQFPLRRR